MGIASDAAIASVADTINGVANRGNLNWSGNNTTASVSAGYYTGGTLDSRPSYNSGRSQGQSDVTSSPNSYSLYTKAQYDANYSSGWNNGVSAADNRANPGCANWNAGRSQGQSDVTGNPNAYGLYTKSQYDGNWSNGYNSGYSAGVSAKTSNISSGHCTTGNTVNLGWQPNIVLVKRDGDRLPAGLYSSIGVNINYMEGPSQSHTDNAIWTNGSGFGFNGLPSYSNNKWCYYVAARIV